MNLKFNVIPIYALDISDLSYKFLRLKENKNGTVIDNFGSGVIPPNVIKEGEIKNRDAFVSLFKDVFTKNNIQFVAVSMPEEKCFLKIIELKDIDESEIAQALEFQIEEYVPLPSSEVFFEYKIAEKKKDHFDVVIKAFPRIFVEDYLEAIYSAGALPVSVETEFDAIVRAVIPKNFSIPSLIVDWGKSRVGFSIFENNALRSTSTSFTGGEVINRAIADHLKIYTKEAEEIKFQFNVLERENKKGVFDIVFPMILSVKNEIEKHIDYWYSHSEKRTKLEQIFLSGRDSNMLGLAEYFQNELKIKVSLVNPWVNINFPPKYLPDILFRDSLGFTTAIGLAQGLKEKEKIL